MASVGTIPGSWSKYDMRASPSDYSVHDISKRTQFFQQIIPPTDNIMFVYVCDLYGNDGFLKVTDAIMAWQLLQIKSVF